jgi:hypothetical protein
MKIFSNQKPKVLVCVLTGVERHNWISPDLSLNLIRMVKDMRFDVNYFPVRDCRPWESARNMTITAARQINADWLLSFDNDNFVPGQFNPLDIIAAAGEDKHVIGLPYGIGNTEEYTIFPNTAHGACDGPFREEVSVAGGVLMVRNSVWQKIRRGPWFRWQHVESETLAPAPGVFGEDVFFCQLVRQHGMKVWSYQPQAAGHYRTTDLTGMVCSMSQLGKRIA